MIRVRGLTLHKDGGRYVCTLIENGPHLSLLGAPLVCPPLTLPHDLKEFVLTILTENSVPDLDYFQMNLDHWQAWHDEQKA